MSCRPPKGLTSHSSPAPPCGRTRSSARPTRQHVRHSRACISYAFFRGFAKANARIMPDGSGASHGSRPERHDPRRQGGSCKADRKQKRGPDGYGVLLLPHPAEKLHIQARNYRSAGGLRRMVRQVVLQPRGLGRQRMNHAPAATSTACSNLIAKGKAEARPRPSAPAIIKTEIAL